MKKGGDCNKLFNSNNNNTDDGEKNKKNGTIDNSTINFWNKGNGSNNSNYSNNSNNSNKSNNSNGSNNTIPTPTPTPAPKPKNNATIIDVLRIKVPRKILAKRCNKQYYATKIMGF